MVSRTTFVRFSLAWIATRPTGKGRYFIFDRFLLHLQTHKAKQLHDNAYENMMYNVHKHKQPDKIGVETASEGFRSLAPPSVLSL